MGFSLFIGMCLGIWIGYRAGRASMAPPPPPQDEVLCDPYISYPNNYRHD